MEWNVLDSCVLGYGHVGDCCERDDEPPRSGTVSFSRDSAAWSDMSSARKWMVQQCIYLKHRRII